MAGYRYLRFQTQFVVSYDLELSSSTGQWLETINVPALLGVGGNAEVELHRFAQTQPNNTYRVRARAVYRNITGNYGNVCTFSIGAISEISLQSSVCNTSIPSQGTVYTLTAEGIDYAIGYTFGLFDGTGTVLLSEYTSAFESMNFFDFGTASPGNSYQVKVKAVVRGVSGTYGPGCPIELQENPTSRLLPEYCGISYTTLTANVEAEMAALPQAAYTFGLFDASGQCTD